MKFLRHPKRVTALWLLLLPIQLNPAPQSLPQTEISDLRSKVVSIHCSSNQNEAAHHLRELQEHRLTTPGIPFEATTGNSTALRATTLNKALIVLADSAKKFPQNKNLVEQTVIRWNFCSVIDNNTVYDHRRVNGRTERYPSAVADTDLWSGFHAFGLMPHTNYSNTDSFNFTTPHTNTVIRSLANQRLQQRYIAHCLPHPDDEHLYRDYGRNFISRAFPPSKVKSPLTEQEWRIECKTEVPPLVESPPTPDTQEQNTTIVSNSIPKPLQLPEPEPEPEPDNIVVAPEPATVTHNEPIVKLPQLAAAIELRTAEPPPILIEKKPPESVAVPIPTQEAEMVLPSSIQPDTNLTPVVITGRRTGNDIVSPTTSKTKGFSGSISLNNRSFRAKDTSINFSVSYKPVKDSYWFIRSGFNISQESNPLTYSWGIGYDDWHAGTWAVQLNHWGPLKPGDGLDIKNSVAEVSYKLKQTWLEKRNLSSSLSLSKPLSSNPSLNWGWSWNPHSHWFIRSTMIKPLGESGLDWSYGFGYTRYSNNSVSIEYNNWGINEFPDLNFKKNALISLIYRWAF